MSDNLDLWNRLAVTDEKFTRSFTDDETGFTGTAINPTYVARRLTEEFGPAGTGWRFDIEGEGVVHGNVLADGAYAQLHWVRGHIVYFRDGLEARTGTQYGQTVLVGEKNGKTYMDADAMKKSATDCLSKCATYLGVAADIYLGRFDENKYVNTAKPKRTGNPRQKKADKLKVPATLAEAIAVIATLDGPALATFYNDCRDSQLALVGGPGGFTDLSKAVGERCRVVCEMGSSERAAISAALKCEKLRADGNAKAS